ncbi:hypothetical protein BKN38_05170 [Helicobacter sp. CLO-3]|uniref:arginine--tRNA ligase n=1 Tax=unclassified Helicobacter TaxID=2593540 RepID=UPI000805F4C3|nr:MULTISPECIES: arginine--tRNA ligase [unclassified Helicobacter]OBV29119.1 hypothetical protein BA723_06695 [Helicobacter sp. CLO-3]OHU83713.1 hypothetical protein BKN38_05170 [Helicobacter sp. CLO-3]
MYEYIKSIITETAGSEAVLECPKNRDFGHFATPIAFSLAKQQKLPPSQIASELCAKLSKHKEFAKVDELKGYINLTLSPDFINAAMDSALDSGLDFGKGGASMLKSAQDVAESMQKSESASTTKEQKSTLESKLAPESKSAQSTKPSKSATTNQNISTSQATPISQATKTTPATHAKTTAPAKSRILLEYVSANPTGPLHIGHARGAVLGDSLYRLGSYLGHDITTEYYINDAGAQIQKLATSIYLAGREAVLGECVEYPEDCYKGEYIIDIARAASEHFGKSVFENESRIAELGEFGKDLMLKEIEGNLASVGIKFHHFVSEKALFARWDETLEALKSGGGVYEEGGKIWLASSQKGDEKDRVIVREDGEPTYLAGDIIYHRDKFMRDFDHYINIWGADHHGYIARVRASIAYLGFDETRLEVLLAQMVSLLKDGKPYKMSKRAGNFILMRDVVADIGAAALRFVFLSKKPDTHLEFDVSTLSAQDASNPVFYINYANARIHTLLEKSSAQNVESSADKLDAESSAPNASAESGAESTNEAIKAAQDLAFEAMLLPRIAQMAWEERSLQKICEYLKTLAGNFHAFYNAHRILGTPHEAYCLKSARMVSLSLTLGLSLLGIQAQTKM